MAAEEPEVPEELRRQIELHAQRLDQQEREQRMQSERTARLEEMAQKVNYALFGLQGNNGLIGALEKVGDSLSNVNKRIDEKEEKDDRRWSNLQWRIVAAAGSIILLLLTVLGAVLTHS